MKIKDINVWGTVHEGRVLPVKSMQSTPAAADSVSARSDDAEFGSQVADQVLQQLAHAHQAHTDGE
jgi:hypothetical protein